MWLLVLAGNNNLSRLVFSYYIATEIFVDWCRFEWIIIFHLSRNLIHHILALFSDILKQFNPSLLGYSTGTGEVTSPTSRLNRAWSGAMAKWVSGFNPSPLGQNGRRFADDVFRCIFVNEKFCILLKISLKYIPKGPIDNNPAVV